MENQTLVQQLEAGGWQKVATVYVDAGMIWIGDPCYILEDSLGGGSHLPYRTLVDILHDVQERVVPVNHRNEVDHESGHMGVVFMTGGDGQKSVYVLKDMFGAVIATTVVFDEHYEV